MKASFKLERFASISVLPFYQPNAYWISPLWCYGLCIWCLHERTQSFL